ncbi:MAG TPA: peptidylprolyl isomerase [Candidatus Acidoferrum sp.]|nr:peptidylprolyl isomerase [Candidatus Acidoferrum sp.]
MKTFRIPGLLLAVLALIASPVKAQSIYCVETTLDTFCIQLLNDNSVAAQNFINYVNSGTYSNTLMNFSERNRYLQGGQYKVPLPIVTTTTTVITIATGDVTSSTTDVTTATDYNNNATTSNTTTTSDSTDTTATSVTVAVAPSTKLDPLPVTTNAPIHNEYTGANPNVRGTVAFVVTPGQPDSATSGFRVNASDNTGDFNSPANTGAVFANVVADGMAVVDRLSHLPVYPLGFDYLSQAPMLQLDNQISADDVVQIKKIILYNDTLDNLVLNGPPDQPVADIQPVTCLETTMGEMCLQLFTADAPNTVANFLTYANNGTYNATIIHRLAKNTAADPLSVFQGGGYTLQGSSMVAVSTNAPIALEQTGHSNVRGTIAMARTGDTTTTATATSQWFINYQDNVSLDTLNGGYAVFGQVIPSSLAVMDSISYLSTIDATSIYGGAFTELPILYSTAADGTTDPTNYTPIDVSSVINDQRDVSESAGGPQGPLRNVMAMGTYTFQYNTDNQGARFPVRIGSNMYMLVMEKFLDRTNTDDPDNSDPTLFAVDLVHIIQLKENGRIAATYGNGTLTIPTVRVGENVYTNVVMQLVDPTILKFRLISFDQI